MNKRMLMKIVQLWLVLVVLCIPAAQAVIVAKLEPYRTHNIIVKKRTVEQIDQIKNGKIVDANAMKSYATSLEDDEEVLLRLRRFKSEAEEGDEDKIVFYQNNETVTLDLVPGTYLMDAQLIKNANVTIPEDERDYCQGIAGGDWDQIGSSAMSMAASGGVMYLGSVAGLWGFTPMGLYFGVAMLVAQMLFDCVGVEKTVTIPSVTMNPAILGGAVGNVTFTAEDLDGRNTTVLYVFGLRPPQVIEDLALSADYESLSRSYPYMLVPTGE